MVGPMTFGRGQWAEGGTNPRYIRCVTVQQRDEWKRLIPGFGAIAVATAPIVWKLIDRPELIRLPRVGLWWLAVAAFTFCLALPAMRALSQRALVAIQWLMSALALAANYLIPMAIEGVALTGILLVVAAAGFARFSRRAALVGMTVQLAGLLVIYRYSEGWPPPIAFSAAFAYGAMQFVVHSTWRLANLERERRIMLEGAMRELRSTHAMLEDAVRASQRSEIARNLHDVVGHHLVALGLQLDAMMAAPQASDVADRLAKARQLVRLLLTDVREVVSGLQELRAVDLRTALGNLATEGPGPRVRVTVDDAAPQMTSDMAQALLRCAQEALTNARKHAQAREVVIALRPDALVVTDDGRGISGAAEGFGLASMRARCESIGCALSVGNAAGGGTALTIRWTGDELGAQSVEAAHG